MNTLRLFSILGLVLAACGGPAPAGDAAVRHDGGATRTAEAAACAHLAELRAAGCPLVEDADCEASFVDIRTNFGEPDCRAEYDAFLACVTTTSCPDAGSGALCAAEYSALGICGT